MVSVGRRLVAVCTVSFGVWAVLGAAACGQQPQAAANSSSQPCGPVADGRKDACPGPEFTRPWWSWWKTPCDRVPHNAYPPVVPGSYYFRPYSVIQLRENQADVMLWGGDPRNPYSNELFQRVYNETGNSSPPAKE